MLSLVCIAREVFFFLGGCIYSECRETRYSECRVRGDQTS
ncbi:unnamed protein product [Staurois parvus]|uniref:Uncharacterized protein n=1 Tax=Staurois parvus TaxID=386267 RepID=A0ABN9GDY2_9NEOB|nr:unnamed protein product [Staurois parvus]